MKYILQEYHDISDKGIHYYKGDVLRIDDSDIAHYLFYSDEPGKFFPTGVAWKPFHWSLVAVRDSRLTNRYYDSLDELVGDNFVEFL